MSAFTEQEPRFHNPSEDSRQPTVSVKTAWMNQGKPLPEKMQKAFQRAARRASKAEPRHKVSKPDRKQNAELVALVSLWQTHMAGAYPVYQKPLTKTEMRMLEGLQQSYGEACASIIAHALQNWPTLTLRVLEICPFLRAVPTLPKVSFLCSYHDEARGLHNEYCAEITRREKLKAAAKTSYADGGQPPFPLVPMEKKFPIVVTFTPEQIAVLVNPSDKRHEAFTIALIERYGNDCIIGGGPPCMARECSATST